MIVPFSEPVYLGKEREYLLDAFDSTWISGGKYIGEFENKLSEILGGGEALAVSNGTTALELAYLATEPQELKEILVPSFAFMAAANVAVNFCYDVKFVDVDPDTWNLTVEGIEKSKTKRTVAVVVVHNYGNVSDMERIAKFCHENELILIEDCAESLFSKYNNKYCGNFGSAGTFSFHATKTITTGEGGLLYTNSPYVGDLARLIRSHGLKERGNYFHVQHGMNYRMTNLQAAIGLGQIEHVDYIIQRKKEIYKQYVERLYSENGIHFQKVEDECDPTFWSVAIKLDSVFPSIPEIIYRLKEYGIETRPGFQTGNNLPLLYGTKYPLDTPVGDELSSSVIVLPTYTSITESEVDFVCNMLKKCRKE